MLDLIVKRPKSNIYNMGTGHARSWLDLARACFAAMKTEPNIEFIEMPGDIRDQYQYFTEAKMEKLRSIGYAATFTRLEDGVAKYVAILNEQ